LTSLQSLIRQMINLAYLPDKRNGVGADAVISRYHEATVEWNSRMYAALLVSAPELAELVPVLDREVDRLLDQAMARQWTRNDFRTQRLELGRLAATYLRTARRLAALPPVDLMSVWTWDKGPEMAPTAD
jgi:hypothetical protein